LLLFSVWKPTEKRVGRERGQGIIKEISHEGNVRIFFISFTHKCYLVNLRIIESLRRAGDDPTSLSSLSSDSSCGETRRAKIVDRHPLVSLSLPLFAVRRLGRVSQPAKYPAIIQDMRKKGDSFRVEYGTWRMELRGRAAVVISAILSGSKARLAENRRTEFLITVSVGFRKGPPCPAGTPQHFSV